MERGVLFFCWLHWSILSSNGHREHKVHNIVLYPDKHSWCKTTAIKQVVGGLGCEGVEVENSVCVGTCFSYSIPRTEPTAPGQVEPYCDSCQPSRVTWKHVTLKCTGLKGGTVTKRVEVIEDCACSACDAQEVNQHVTHAHQEALDVPQLINLVNSTKNNPPHLNISQDRVSLLLKVLGDGDGDEDLVDQQALKEIIAQIVGDDESLDRNTLEDIAHKAEEMGHIKVDIGKLRQILANKMVTEETDKFPSSHRHHHHHHVHGPHHSRVLDGDNPTLDMAPHQLKPAVEGSEITYHANPTSLEEEN